MINRFDDAFAQIPFLNQGEYIEYMFACVNMAMDAHLSQMKRVFATGQGGYKNVLYPDLETAADICAERISGFQRMGGTPSGNQGAGEDDEFPEDLLALFDDFSEDAAPQEEARPMTAAACMDAIARRAEKTLEAGIPLPFYELCRTLDMDSFAMFCFAAGILASTQTDYAGVFQVINESGGLSAPTIESAAKLYFGEDFSIAGAYGEMSVCLERLMLVLDLQVRFLR